MVDPLGTTAVWTHRATRAVLWLAIGLGVGYVAWACTPSPPETYTDADGFCHYAATGDPCDPEPPE